MANIGQIKILSYIRSGVVFYVSLYQISEQLMKKWMCYASQSLYQDADDNDDNDDHEDADAKKWLH